MANMVNLLNTILSNASAEYQARVPSATQNNITEVGSAIMSYSATENEFLNILVNKIAMQIVHNKTFRNPLSVLKKGKMPLGRNLEEIYTNPATGTIYDPSGADLLARSLPDTKAIYHTMNRQGKYKVTVSKAQLLGAFTSYEKLEQLLNSIVNSIYSGDNLDEFMLMKELVASAIKGGKMVHHYLGMEGIEDESAAKSFVKQVKTIGQAMEFPSTVFNSYYNINSATDAKPVTTWTPKENQILILRNDISVNVDVELLAKAFNVSYTDLEQRTLIVDSFGTDTECAAVICDEAVFQIYDNLQQMDSFHNGEGLYDNFIYHHWQTYSLSLFANAVALLFGSETSGGIGGA